MWPTFEEVRNSHHGLSSEGSIPAQILSLFDESPGTLTIKSYLSPLFCKSTHPMNPRSRAAPHIKNFLRYAHDDNSTPTELLYFLLSSHNFSQASWGGIQKNGTQYAIEHY